MQTVTRNDIATLAKIEHPNCVSMYMPLHQDVGSSQQDPIRYKNMVREAIEQLRTSGLRHNKIDELMAPAVAHLKDHAFVQQAGRGLAFFLAPAFSRCMFLAEPVPELVVSGTHLELGPLLPFVVDDKPFYILTLSQQHVRLLSCARQQRREIFLEDVPSNLKEALQEDVPGRGVQFHMAQSTGRNGRDRQPVFHGQEAGQQELKAKIRLFFIQINRGVMAKLGDNPGPLILAGVEYLLDIYRSANTYLHLLPAAIPVSVDSRSDDELHQQAWQLIRAQLQAEGAAQLRRYEQIVHTKTALASHRIKEILPAAHYGKIEALLVPSNNHWWGSFDLDSQRLHYSGQPGYANNDLLGEAATQTMLHGGRVFFIDADSFADLEPAKAILRR